MSSVSATKPEIAVKKKLFDERVMSFLFLVCWIAYFSSYLGRYNFSAAIAEMTAQNVLTKSSAGLIGTAYFCSYGAGQILSGFLGDRLSSRNMVFIGLIGSSMSNVAMGLSSSAAPMVILWLLNGVAQSLTWSPLVKLFADRLPRRQCLKACINISTSCAAGTLAAYLMSAVGIALTGWRSVFFYGALLMAAFGSVLVYFRHKDRAPRREKGLYRRA